jgi:hypothetical protein
VEKASYSCKIGAVIVPMRAGSLKLISDYSMKKRAGSQRVSLVLGLALMVGLGGCQKNSYESCIEFQTDAVRREIERDPQSNGDEQEMIDYAVRTFCRDVH